MKGEYVKKIIAITIALSISAFAYAQTDWITIAATDDGMKWDVQPGSLEFSKTVGGTSIAVVIGKVSDAKTGKINLYKWYVSANDCQTKMGKVVSLGISGEYIFENDFVFGSGNVASSMAEAICNAADYVINERAKKSL